MTPFDKPLHLAAAVLATLAAPALAADAPLPLTDLYRATLPCVVQLYQVRNGQEVPDPFKAFFGGKPTPGRKAEPQETRETQQPAPNGLGLLWGDGSFVLTAEFLVETAKDPTTPREFVLEAQDGRRVEAKLHGVDRVGGIALLKTATPLGPACRFGDSAALQVGQPVVAIGNLQRLRLLMSQGIVSGLLDANPDTPGLAILTSTVSGQGMAGGPLLDLQGRVVGMHQAVLPGGTGYGGISVALPMQRALASADELARHGKVLRPRLGVNAEDERLPVGKAALLQPRRSPIVSRVLAGSPAQRAGVREGDRLVALDGLPLADTADLRRRVAATRPGTPVRIDLERDGTPQSISVTIDAVAGD